MANPQFQPTTHLSRSSARGAPSVLETNRVLRNTYMLLSMTLLFSAAMAGLAMAMRVPPLGILPILLAFGMIFIINAMRNSHFALPLVFAFTGLLGFNLGPILGIYLSLPNGHEIVMTSIGLTGLIFLSLSAYTLTTRKDFSFMAGFVFTGLWVMLGAMLILWFGPMFGLEIPGLHLAFSAGVVILMSALILFDTSRIIHGGETNYVLATVSLYLSIYNLLVSLLHLVGLFSGGDD